MSDEWISWLLKLLNRPPVQPPTDAADLAQIDRRLGAVEGKQSELDVRLVRLELLEHQADPRGVREGNHDV